MAGTVWGSQRGLRTSPFRIRVSWPYRHWTSLVFPVHGREIGRLGDAEGIPEQNYQHSDGRVLGHLVPSVLPAVGIVHIAAGFQSQKSAKTSFP